MGTFKDWLESTARSRDKMAAAKGLAPKKTGAETNAHRTEPVVEKSVGKSGEIGDKPLFGKPKGKKNKHPDYDIPEHKADPSWMKVSAKKKAKKTKEMAVKEDRVTGNKPLDIFANAAQDFKDKLASMIGQAKSREAELDAQADDDDSGPSQDGKDDDESNDTWEKLRKTAKERDAESEEESSDSDGATSSQ